jgi:antitoxin (DNA-binding transcriptional repressor) of toxin-antitoxin stability system
MVHNMVMIKANVFEVKARLSEFLDRAANGERIVVCRHNKPIAELRALDDARTEPRPIGPLRGRPTFDVPASFFEPLSDDDLDLWDGGAVVSPPSYVRRPANSRGTRVAERGPRAPRATRAPRKRRS